MFTQSSTRLNKYISESGICSRREADRFIEQGNVFINGKRAKVGDQVAPGDHVKVNGQPIEPQDAEDFVLIALNKPVGIVSTTESNERDNIVDFVRHSKRIFPIGRLDKDSQGLIFLTSNGDLVNKILRAGNNHEKEYLVTVDKPISNGFIEGMAAGVPILGVVTKKCAVEKVSKFTFRITLVQGLNRQIRRMCEHFDYKVQQLNRVRIMHVDLKGLPVGEWRDFTEKELVAMFKAVEGSSSEASGAGKKAKKTHSAGSTRKRQSSSAHPKSRSSHAKTSDGSRGKPKHGSGSKQSGGLNQGGSSKQGSGAKNSSGAKSRADVSGKPATRAKASPKNKAGVKSKSTTKGQLSHKGKAGPGNKGKPKSGVSKAKQARPLRNKKR